MHRTKYLPTLSVATNNKLPTRIWLRQKRKNPYTASMMCEQYRPHTDTQKKGTISCDDCVRDSQPDDF